MRHLSIAVRIWLSISLLVFGFLVVVVTVFVQGLISEEKLAVVVDDVMPAAGNSIEMLSNFNQQFNYFEESVLTGDDELLASARRSGESLVENIKRICLSKDMPVNQRELAFYLRGEVSSLNSDAVNVYSNLILSGDAPSVELQDQVAGLADRFSNVRENMLGLHYGIQSNMSGYVSSIQKASQKQRYFNVAVFFVVLLLSLTTVSYTINRYAIDPWRKLMKTLGSSGAGDFSESTPDGDEVAVMSARILEIFEREKSMTDELRQQVVEREGAQEHLAKHKERLEDLVDERTNALKESSEELRRERDKAQLYLDTAGAIIIALDAKGCVTLINKKGCEVLRCDSYSVVGVNWFDTFIPKQDRSELGKRFNVLFRGEVASMDQYQNEVLTSKGELKLISWQNSLIKDKNNKVIGVLSSGSDVTEKIHLEAELLQAQRLESVGQLAAGMAHEINTPAQFVGDNIKFLKDSVQDLLDLQEKEQVLIEEAQNGAVTPKMLKVVEAALSGVDLDYLAEEIPKAIEQSLGGVERIAKIVSAMKEFSCPGPSEIIAANINRAIETTITVAKSEWKYIADLEMDLDQDLPPVCCIVSEFNQVMLNMIVNARDAIAGVLKEGSDEKGSITITTRKVDQWAEICVSDDGGGIPEEIQDRIFDPFFTTKKLGAGLGQGLAFAYNVIVNKHKGELTFDTEKGKGTTFRIRLPLKEL